MNCKNCKKEITDENMVLNDRFGYPRTVCRKCFSDKNCEKHLIKRAKEHPELYKNCVKCGLPRHVIKPYMHKCDRIKKSKSRATNKVCVS